MKNRILSATIAAALVANFFLSCSFSALKTEFYALDVNEETIAALESGNDYIPRSVGINSNVSTLKGDTVYPEYYSSADLGYTSGVDNQGSTEICWAFAHNEVLEINLAKKYNVKYDLSEQSMKFETSNLIEPLYGYMRNPNGAGNELFSTAYLSRTGSVTEADEPFSEDDERTVDGSSLERIGRLQSVPMYEFGVNTNNSYKQQAINTIKSLVTDYGAAGAGMYYFQSAQYQNNSKSNYYYDGTSNSANHSVTIVGWDDNYSADNFAHTPAGNGAFIVKNSWGLYHDNGKSDYVYVSYYDKQITNQIFSTDYTLDTDLYDNTYMYDPTGWVQLGGISGKKVLCTTRFVADSPSETVTAVGTYITQPDVTVKVMINGTGSNLKSMGAYTTVFAKTFDAAGYYVLPISPVELSANEYYVAIEYTFGSGNATFAIQSNVRRFTDNSVNIPNTCYISSSTGGLQKSFATLNAIENVYSGSNEINSPMLCIKAFTKSAKTEQLTNISDYTDVPTDAWYANAVDYAIGAGLFSGVSDTSFEPDTQMSRAMFVKVLANLTSVDLSSLSKPEQFTDVEADRWYTGAVAWANKNNIVNGVSDTEFKPYESVTREQMCVMIMRYADYLGIAFDYSYGDFRFDDDAGIHQYAKDAVYQCKRYGIINGTTATAFEPTLSATRAQVSNLFTNFCRNYIY